MKNVWGMVSFVLFIIGLILSVLGGLFMPDAAWVIMALAIIGLIMGILYALSVKEINTLLLATIALLAMTAAFAPIAILGIGKAIGFVLIDFAALMAPVALISAIKALIMIGLEKK
jgi:hypothetical protein